MAGHVGQVAQSSDGTYGFTLYDEKGRAALYLGFSSLIEADKAARDAQSLLVAARSCQRQ
jgi:hypothetical protein